MKNKMEFLLLIVITMQLVCNHCIDCRSEMDAPAEIRANDKVHSVDKRDSCTKDCSLHKTPLCGRTPALTAIYKRDTEDYNDVIDEPHLDRILGGSYATYGEFPWMASVHFDNDHVCGGAIINEFWILSAAHCFFNGIQDKFAFSVGDHRLKSPDDKEIIYKADKIIIHDQYRAVGWVFDIALIKLEVGYDGRGIQFNNYVQPVCLAMSTEDLLVGTPLIFSGWGQTYKYADESPILKKTILPVLEFEECKKIFPKVTTANCFCAGFVDGSTDVCIGDTGGPAVYKSGKSFILYGIAMFSTGCRKPNYPTWFSSVSKYRGWIDATIRSNSNLSERIMPVRSYNV